MTKTLKSNTLTKSLVSGAAAIATLAGVGLASSPAHAGIFTLGPDRDGVRTTDTESGAPGELIWTTFDPFPVPGSIAKHGKPGVDGYDNPLISHSGGGVQFKIEYFGSGTATQTNNFFWDKASLFGPQTGPGIGDGGEVCANVFGNPCAETTVPTLDDVLPFVFTTQNSDPNNGALANTIVNGEGYDGTDPHYFATIDGTLGTTSGDVVYLGLSDRPGATGDDDSADYVVKITSVQKAPEPGTILGLLAVGGLGVALKRKKQEG